MNPCTKFQVEWTDRRGNLFSSVVDLLSIACLLPPPFVAEKKKSQTYVNLEELKDRRADWMWIHCGRRRVSGFGWIWPWIRSVRSCASGFGWLWPWIRSVWPRASGFGWLWPGLHIFHPVPWPSLHTDTPAAAYRAISRSTVRASPPGSSPASQLVTTPGKTKRNQSGFPIYSIAFQSSSIRSLVKDHWRGLSIRNVRLVHIVYLARFYNGVSTILTEVSSFTTSLLVSADSS